MISSKADGCPRCSVLVTTYNHERFIAQALESVLMQRVDFEYEIIIGEDCSIDRTRDLVRGFANQHKDKIRLILPPKNLGFSGNKIFEQQLRAVKGNYIAVLDGDDYWESPSKLQKQVDFMERHPDCAMCFHAVKVVYEGDTQASWISGGAKRISKMEDLLEANFMHTCSVMLRKESLTNVPGWCFTSEIGDWELFLIAAQHGDIGYIDEVMAVYRKHEDGVYTGSDIIQRIQSRIRMYNNLIYYLEPRHKRTISAILSKYYYNLALQCLYAEDWANAKRYSVMSLWVSPRNKRLAIIERLGLCSRLYAPKFYNFVRYFRASVG